MFIESLKDYEEKLSRSNHKIWGDYGTLLVW